MTTTQDASIGIVPEVTYGTGVTVTRWLEYLDESLDFRKNIKQGQGLRVGSRVARSQRRVIASADGGGDFSLECVSKGMGLVWQVCLGAGVSTVVSGATYQQNFTIGDTPPSFTLQKGLPEVGGTVDAYTFLGCMVSAWEFDFPNADVPSLKVTVDAKDLTTATAYATPSYAATPTLYSFAGGSISSGTLTAPTTIAMGSGSTQVADVRSGTLKVDNALSADRYNFGGAGRKAKPTTGLRAITGSLVVEYDSTTFRDAVLNDTPMALILNFVGGSLSVGTEQLQIIVPEIKFDSEIPKTNGTDLITQNMAFQGLDNLTAPQPLYVSVRTADNAL